MLVFVAAGSVRLWWPAVAMRLALERARATADDPQRFTVRLSVPERSAARSVALLIAGGAGHPTIVAATLMDRSKNVEGDAARRVRAVAHFIDKDCKSAAAELAAIARPEAADWNDLAAAELCAASATDEQERLGTALVAIDRARAAAPRMREALFNRAAILEAMGAHRVAALHWLQFLLAEPRSPWASAARRRLTTGRQAEREAWQDAVRRRQHVSLSELSRLTAMSPEQARRFGEGLFLSQWAQAMADGDHAAAQESLDRARLIGTILQRTSGESLLADSVAAIERAAGRARDRLVTGHLAYARGRAAYDGGRYEEAERHLREAARALGAARSPMASWAASFATYAVYDQDQPDRALDEARALLAAQRDRARTYPALVAHLQYQIALYEAVHGHWSASIAAADHAARTYTALGERTMAAAAMATLAEDYDFLGQPEAAWRHGIAALRLASASGDLLRARTVLAVLCRTEMRGRRWERARAVASLESELGAFAAADAYDADLFRRRAVADWFLGRTRDAMESIALGRDAAARVPVEALRIKLAAELDGAAGMILSRTDPPAAVRLLTVAIDRRRQARRPILLPELHLQRGRAYLAMNALLEAERDFAAGISELERQRGRVDDAQLRAGIFADSSDIFDEAVMLQLRLERGPESVLAYVERGRARAMLEEMEGVLPLARPTVTIRDIQRKLVSESVLVEYVALPRMLAIVLITPDRSILRVVDVERRDLESAAHRLAASLADGKEPGDSVLYDALIEPIARDLEGVRAINIVADPVFDRLPFAALRPRNSGVHLIQRYVLATSPSAAVFAATTDRLPDTPPRSVAVFGNPEVSRHRFPGLANLDAAEREASLVAARYGRSQIFVRRMATVRAFLTSAPYADVIHFGGHAVVRPLESAMSALIFAADHELDGMLTLRRIVTMHFPSTQVAVLAACSTLKGRDQAVEGVPSIARAFLIAGVPAVVGTLWDIDDSEAAPLMRDLHDGIARGDTPADALQRAQIEAIETGRPAAVWAAFALTGVAAAAGHAGDSSRNAENTTRSGREDVNHRAQARPFTGRPATPATPAPSPSNPPPAG